MSSLSKIEWTESTWNPVTGCSKISAGCQNCYAERLSKRLEAMGNPNNTNGFTVTIHEQCLALPFVWKKPRIIFVNSMSDLFHEDIPDEFIMKVFSVMREAHWHTFQVLTKRSERLLQLNSRLRWPSNVRMGVTVENAEYLTRIDHLRQTGAKVAFLSLEPLIGQIRNLDLSGIDWVIVGGESGCGARKMEKEWVIDIRDQCIGQHVPFFFKQWGGVMKKRNGRILENRTWDEMPVQ